MITTTTEEFSTTGQLWALERKLSNVARDIETLTQCVSFVASGPGFVDALELSEYGRMMDRHLMDLRRITGAIAAARRGLR
jgi:hypothetical protein